MGFLGGVLYMKDLMVQGCFGILNSVRAQLPVGPNWAGILDLCRFHLRMITSPTHWKS